MRSTASPSTPIDNKIGYNFSAPRPIFVRSSMTSLQAAARSSGDNMYYSPLRSPRPSTSYSFADHVSSPGFYQGRSNSVIAPSSPIDRQNTTNLSPSAFSSLYQASTEAGLHTCNNTMTALSNQLSINRTQNMQASQDALTDKSRTLQNHSCIGSNSRYETEYNDDEPEMTWNPPIREAVFSTLSPLPIYSPLTVPSNRSTPTHSHGYEHTSTHQGNGYLSTGPSSQSRHRSASPFAFVPIQEWDNETDEALSYKENTTYCSSSPSKLSSDSKSWEPHVDLSHNGTGIPDGINSRDYFLQSCHRYDTHKPLFPSNLKTPTKASSSENGANGFYDSSSKMAPSPTFTVETADMTLDTPSIDGSCSIDNRSIKASSLLVAMGAPPIYSSPSQPTSNTLRRNDPYNSDMAQKSTRQSSLSVALATGMQREHPGLVTLASSSSQQGYSSVEYPQYSYCYPSTDQEEAQNNRAQSAPTLGRPSFIAPTKNDEDAQQRKCRVKTELCMHYENGRPCPFGSNCTYAHGEEELQMTKLIDLHEAGLVDMITYRTKPCLTWVATGSCPFGKRCTGLHDYRVGSSTSQSWLPHTETQGNTIATDINVDGLHQKRLHTILYDNPFGDHFTLTSTSPSGRNSTTGKGTWDDLNRLVCGGNNGSEGGLSFGKNPRDGWIAGSNKRGGRQIHPIYKLQIALKMRGTDPDWQYKYRPQHVVHDELCMILQKRAFRVTSNEHNDSSSKNTSSKAPLTASNATAISSVAEIPLSTYNSRSPNQILVHEIAFGPDSDPSVRGVALWFNISADDITECTPQQAKRFRWKKNIVNPSMPSTVSDKKSGSASTKASLFDSGAIESVVLIRPHDTVAFRLVTDIMKLRLSVLKRERMSNMKERFETQQKLKKQEERLKERFDNIRRSWLHWAWPVNCEREHVDDTTPVPPVEGPYLLKKRDGSDPKSAESVHEKKDPALDVDSIELGKHIHTVWDSFVATIVEENENDLQSCQNSKRLSLFENLRQGKPLSDNRCLPHITKDRAFQNDLNESSKGTVGAMSSYSIQQERCWKSLLLQSDSLYEVNEWEIVREHFENSRSKKVLSIIQQ